ncbi:MAG: PQQ-binding-like beta-propeller repeat protein [Bacteroidales bacterium]|nr:PQQ-binding-like beta-propeller repeat protein [Bacteroidales bacterium]
MKKLNVLVILIYTLLFAGGNEMFGVCGNYGAGGATEESASFSKFAINALAQDSIIKFAFLTDLHISDVATNAEDLEKSVADINSMPDIKFAIFGGDITEFGSDEEIAHAYSIISKLKIPWYIVAGNHDSKWSESGCNTFAKVFGYEHFDFEAGGIRFIGCNSGPNMRMAPALVPRDAVLWLDSLTKVIPPSQPVVFINHYPLDDAMLNYKTILEYLARTNTQVAICGHGHNDRVMKYAPLFSPLRGVMGRSNLRAGKGGAGYNIITVNTAQGAISFQERISGGITKDAWHSIKMIKPKSNSRTSSLMADNALAASEQQKSILKPKAIFEWQDDSDIGSAAVMDENGRIYLANTKGVVKAFSAKSKQSVTNPIWQFATSGKIFSTPAISGGSLVVGSSDAYIYCINAKTGNLIWKVKAGKSVLASPTIFKGRVYIGASDGTFRAIDLKSGNLIWEYKNIKGFVEAKAYVDDKGVYIGSWGSTLYALNPDNGSLLWSWTNNKGRGLSPAAVWPVKANGKIFIVTPERVTHALDATTGNELWRAKGGRESVGLSPDASVVYVKTMQDTVFAYNTITFTDGRPDRLWASHTGFGYEIAPSPITSAYGFVFVPTDKGNIFVLNEKDGSVYGIIPFSGALINYVQPAGNRRILVSSMDGKVALLEL